LADAFGRLLGLRRQFDAEHLLRVTVFNRLCDPESKLGILRWLEGGDLDIWEGTVGAAGGRQCHGQGADLLMDPAGLDGVAGGPLGGGLGQDRRLSQVRALRSCH
jgi:hypothetical protein